MSATPRTELLAWNVDALPWAPWAMHGAWFKLLHADPATGRFSLLIRLDPGAKAPLHRHVGAVEGMVLEGGFHYVDAPAVRYGAGTYLHEPAGAVHQPFSAEGALMFGVFQGPLEGLSEEGELTGRIDATWHLETWREWLAIQPSA